MDRILPPEPARSTVIYAVAGPRKLRGRGMIAGLCTLGALYLAFAVGTPWLLREAPPDTYAVVATKAACPAPTDGDALCAAAQRSAIRR